MLPPFAATAGFASTTKEEAGPQRCTTNRDTRMCLCLCVFSSLHEAAPIVSWIAECLFGGSWLLTSPPGQHWGKGRCMPGTEGCRCACIQACILHAEIHFGAIPVHVAQRHRIAIHSIRDLFIVSIFILYLIWMLQKCFSLYHLPLYLLLIFPHMQYIYVIKFISHFLQGFCL